MAYVEFLGTNIALVVRPDYDSVLVRICCYLRNIKVPCPVRSSIHLQTVCPNSITVCIHPMGVNIVVVATGPSDYCVTERGNRDCRTMEGPRALRIRPDICSPTMVTGWANSLDIDIGWLVTAPITPVQPSDNSVSMVVHANRWRRPASDSRISVDYHIGRPEPTTIKI